jgi:hypothetical protein
MNYNRRGGRNYFVRKDSRYSGACNVSGHSHGDTIADELYCHIPVTIISMCLSLIIMVFICEIFSIYAGFEKLVYGKFFHICHYTHILFASMGSIATFLRFSRSSYLWGAVTSLINSMLFCSLSDIVLPSFVSKILGKSINMHICLFNSQDLFNILVFGFLGIICGVCMSFGEKRQSSSLCKKIHAGHIWMSCLAALFYIFSQNSVQFIDFAGTIVIALSCAVVVPCVLSDVLVPIVLVKHMKKWKLL